MFIINASCAYKDSGKREDREENKMNVQMNAKRC